MSTPLLAAKLTELRQNSNYSQQDIADYLGMTREGYSHYERNAREPSLNALVKLCKLYQIDISELINEENVLGIFYIYNNYIKKVDKTLTDLDTHTYITNNMKHFLNLFTGKNSNLNLSNITKEDINLLAQYKLLDKQSQDEVRQFIKFKKSIAKQK